MGQGDVCTIDDCLGQLVVVALEGVGSGFEGIPNLLPALKGRGCVPKFIPLTAELPVRHGVIALPFGLLLLQGLVPTQSHCGGTKGIH